MNAIPSILSFVSGFFDGNPSIPSKIPSNVDPQKFNELTQFAANFAYTEPPQELVDKLTTTILQRLIQAAMIVGAHYAAAQLLAIPGNKLPSDWAPPIPPAQPATIDGDFRYEVLPFNAGIRATHIPTGLSAESTAADTLHEDHNIAKARLDQRLAMRASKPTPKEDPHTAFVKRVATEIFKKHGGAETAEALLAIQQRIAKVMDDLNVKAKVGCILLPDGQDAAEWAALIPTFTREQIVALKKLTDAGDQDAIEKFFKAALAAKKAE